MKKIIISGASGSPAGYVIEALKPIENISLTLYLRNKSRLSKSLAEGCSIIEGDAMDYTSIV